MIDSFHYIVLSALSVMQEPVLKLQLSELKYVTKRRYLLRHVVCSLSLSYTI
jgi:hypothetical protein